MYFIQVPMNTTTPEDWVLIEQLLRTHPPAVILNSLRRNIEQSTVSLQDLVQRVDLRRDAENLRFQFERGQLKDVSRYILRSRTSKIDFSFLRSNSQSVWHSWRSWVSLSFHKKLNTLVSRMIGPPVYFFLGFC